MTDSSGKSGSGNFAIGDDERDHLGVIVLTPYEVYLLGQVMFNHIIGKMRLPTSIG